MTFKRYGEMEKKLSDLYILPVLFNSPISNHVFKLSVLISVTKLNHFFNLYANLIRKMYLHLFIG